MLSTRGGSYAGKIRRDIQEGTRDGVNATPKFYVNGERVDGKMPLEHLVELVTVRSLPHIVRALPRAVRAGRYCFLAVPLRCARGDPHVSVYRH